MKRPDFFSLRAALICLAALPGFAAPLFAHPAGDFIPAAAEGPVTLLAPDRIKDAPFLPDPEYNPLFLACKDIRNKLEDNHISVKVHSVAVFGDGFLIRRTAIETGVNVLTALDTARALVTSLENGEKEEDLTLIDVATL